MLPFHLAAPAHGVLGAHVHEADAQVEAPRRAQVMNVASSSARTRRPRRLQHRSTSRRPARSRGLPAVRTRWPSRPSPPPWSFRVIDPTALPSASASQRPSRPPGQPPRRSSASRVATSRAKLRSRPVLALVDVAVQAHDGVPVRPGAARIVESLRSWALPPSVTIEGVSITLDPGVLAFLGIGVALYVRAVGVARGRGLEVGRLQQAAFYGGVALWAVAMISPLDTLAEDLLSAHMAQHLLLADLGGPLILVGLRAPVIFFFLPKPAMVALARRKTLRRVMRKLTTPLGAIATYAIVLLRLALRACVRGGASEPARARPAAPVVLLHSHPRLDPCARADPPAPAGRALEGWAHPRRATGGDVRRPSSPCARPPTTGT